MDVPIAAVLAPVLAAFFGAPLAVLISDKINKPVARERDALKHQLREQKYDYEKMMGHQRDALKHQLREQKENYEKGMGEQKDSYEARISEVKTAYIRVLDRKLEQSPRKISYQLDAVCEQVQDRLFCNTAPQLSILGINALGPLHQGREIIIDMLKREGIVRVLLLDPFEDVFERRRVVERDSVGRISSEFLASMYILVDILQQVRDSGGAERLELRFHQEYPDRSLMMVNCDEENGVVLANPYPRKKAVPHFEPQLGKRGMEGEMFELVQRGGLVPGYRENVEYFRRLWDGDEGMKIKPAKKAKLAVPEKKYEVEDWPVHVRKMVR